MDGINSTYSKEVIDEKFKLRDEKIGVANHRIDDLETEVKDIKDLTIAITKVNDKVDNVKSDVSEIKESVKSFVAQPQENWKKFKMAIACAIGTGIVGVIIGLIFK